MARRRQASEAEINGAESADCEAETGNFLHERREMRDLSARFTKSTTAPGLDMSLCSRCRMIDLEAVFEAADAGEDLDGTLTARIAHLSKASAKSTCRLCVLLFEARPYDMRKTHQAPLNLCAFNSLTLRGIPRTKARLTEGSSIVLALPFYYDSGPNDQYMPVIVPSIPPEIQLTQRTSFAYGARPLSTFCINHSLVKDWLWDCAGGHKECRLQRPTMKPLKVIDCLRRKIIPSAPDTDYFALSYVWGKQSACSDESSRTPCSGDVPDNIPDVISDAIKLVVSVGFQYLWVDCFCIDQDDKEERHQQISQMGDIYEGAYATIIAAPCKAASQGLPGVSISRAAARSAQISEKVSLQALHSILRVLTSSVWNTRGWTYQEFCLSRRCLVFADDQVHFICQRGTTCEGVEEAALSELPHNKRRCLDPEIFNTINASIGRDSPAFLRHLDAYQQRILTYDSDGLNAFRGILARSRLASYWGVPVFNTDSDTEPLVNADQGAFSAFHPGFSLGLCWYEEDPETRDKPKKRRHGLPSWSWVSSHGTIDYPALFSQEKKNDDLWFDKAGLETFAEVFLHDPSSDDQQSLSTTTTLSEVGSRVITETSPYIYIRGAVETISIEDLDLFYDVDWDCGGRSEHLESPLEMILLVSLKPNWIGAVSCCMLFTTEGDTSHRVGLVRLEPYQAAQLVTISKTIKMG